MDKLTINDIEKIISKDESRTLELKTSTSEIDKAMTTACAFLNSDGGWLIFGVTPKLKIVGQNVTDNTKQEISKYLKRIEPAIDVAVQYIELPDKPDFYIIAIYFDPTSFTNAPYTYDNKAYYKLESTTSPMPQPMYEERLRLSDPDRFSWETTPNPKIKIADLDADQIMLSIHESVDRHRLHASAISISDPMRALKGFRLVDDNTNIILNAANVLFGKDPCKYHIQCKIRLARFEGTDKRVFRDQAINEGNLFEQYDAAVEFCYKHLFLSGRMDRKIREDKLTVPQDVIKEACINMLVHRSWDADNLTPSLAIYDDRMVFQNPGSFPPNKTWKDFLNTDGSMPHNPRIADVFYRRGLMETWGRGIELIMDGCKAVGLPEPTFEVNPPFVNLTIRFKESLGGLNGTLNTTSGNNGTINGTLKQQNGTLNGTSEQENGTSTKEDVTLGLTDTEKRTLEAIRNNPKYTLSQLAQIIGKSRRMVARYVSALKDKGILRQEGSKNNGKWVVLNPDK